MQIWANYMKSWLDLIILTNSTLATKTRSAHPCARISYGIPVNDVVYNVAKSTIVKSLEKRH